MSDVIDLSGPGLDPTGETDCSAYIQSALRERPGAIRVPEGTFRLSSTLRLTVAVDLVGSNTGGRYGGSCFVADRGVTALAIYDNPFAASAQGCTVRNLGFRGGAGPGQPAPVPGILVRAGVSIRDCWVQGFPGDGILIDGGGHAANCWRIDNVTTAMNGGSGLRTTGNDANAGVCVALSSWENGRAGVEEGSFLGSLFLGVHARSNALGGYLGSGEVNRSVFVACYAEADQPASRFGAQMWVLGGIHDPGIAGGQAMTTGQAHARFQADHADAAPLEAMGRPGMSFPAFLVRDRNTTPVAGISEGGTFGSWFAPGWNRPGDGTRVDLWMAPSDTSAIRIGAVARRVDGDATAAYTGGVGAISCAASGPDAGDARMCLVGVDRRGVAADAMYVQGPTIRLAPTTKAERDALPNLTRGVMVGDETGWPLAWDGARWVPFGGGA